MPRAPRIIIQGYAYHLTMRGNEQQQVFFDDADYRQYLLWLAEYCRKYGMRIWAYCLMPNHVHLVSWPDTEDAPSRALQCLQMRYARLINERGARSGHLWQGRFHSSAMDDTHLVAAVRYVERNPVRAGLVSRAEDYMWSSARPHCGLRRDPVLGLDLPFRERVRDWSDWLRPDDDGAVLARLRECTVKCQPCGSKEFVDRFNAALGRGR